MATFDICVTHSAAFNAEVELPNVNNWEEDVKEFWIKWGILHYRVKGDDTLHELDLNMGDPEIDFKRPDSIFIADESGNAAYEEY